MVQRTKTRDHASLNEQAEYSKEGFEQQVLTAIVAMNLPFRGIENPQLRQVFRMLRPSVEIPGRKRLKILLEDRVAEIVAAPLQGLGARTKVSLALDTWTSTNAKSFMAINAYFITESFTYREVLLGFEHLEGAHTGRNMAVVVNKILERYNLTDRVYAITCDNASNNNTMIGSLEETLALGTRATPWSGNTLQVHCLAHVIQLSFKKLLDTVQASATNERIENEWDDSELESLQQSCSFARTLSKVRLPIP